MTEKDLQLVLGELVSRCWDDENFKNDFIKNPVPVFKEYGLPVEEGVEYCIIEAGPAERYIVLPHVQVKETVRELSRLLLTVSEESDEIVPDGVRMIILQNTAKKRYIVIPLGPEIIGEAEMDAAVGGKSKNTTVNINYGVNVNIGVNANVGVTVNAVAGAVVAAGAGAVVAVGAVVFI